ncbi:MATE family efflux transporter [Candidatus Bipolaricaulota bacterium]|nr:MATE family efflux transporter [Candidatus Bipolaricaulota bacterium]
MTDKAKNSSRVERLKDDILHGPIIKTLLLLGWPVMLDNALQMLYNLTDTYWLGKIGKEAVAAPALAFPIDFLIISLGFGFAIAGVSLVSQHTGAGSAENANKAAGQVISFMFISSIFLAGIGYVLAPWLLETLMSAPEGVYPRALNYVRIIFIGMPLMFTFFGARSLLRGVGDMITPMLATGLSVVLNAILDPILIFGLWRIPRLEAAGAALTTVIVRGIASLVVISLLFTDRLEIQIRFRDLILKLRWVKQIVKIGLPSAIGQAGTAVGSILLMSMISRLGVVAVSAYGIGQRVIGLLNVAIWGLASPLTTMIGQNIGAKNESRASSTAKRTYALSFGALITLASIVYLLRFPLFSVFIDDPEVIELGARFLSIFLWSIPFFGVFRLTSSVFRGSGHTRPPMVLSLIRLLPLRVGVSYLLAFGLVGANMGTDGIWLGLFTSNFVAGIMAFSWFLTGSWKERTIKEEPEETASEELTEKTESASLSGSSVD